MTSGTVVTNRPECHEPGPHAESQVDAFDAGEKVVQHKLETVSVPMGALLRCT